MTDTYAFVGCGKSKNPGELAARDKYSSTYFQKKAQWAEENADEWWILSAKYGAVSPDEVIDDYDVTIGDLDRREEAAFYRSVWEEIFPPVGDWFDGRLVVLAGQDYVEALGSILDPGSWEEYEVFLPFENTDGIGEQLAWLTEELESRQRWDRDGDGDTPETEQTTLVPDGGGLNARYRHMANGRDGGEAGGE